MSVISMLTQTRLKRVLRYDPLTGEFWWLKRLGARCRLDIPAGRVGGNGYRGIRIDGVLYYAHRLAILYMTGAWPAEDVDHRRVGKEFRADNRWSELRPATGSQNMANKRLPANNTSGAKGVYWHQAAKKWAAQLKLHGVKQHLGLYEDFEAACAARRTAAEDAFGEFAMETN